MEVSKTISGKVYIRFVRMNDEILLKSGHKLWLDIDFEHVQHTPVVGMVEADSDCGNYLVGDLVIMERPMCEVAVHKDIFPKYKGVDGLLHVFVDSAGVIVRRRKGIDASMNGYVVCKPIFIEHSEVLWTPDEKSRNVVEVILCPEGFGIKNGDKVLFKNHADVYLEHDLHLEFFKFPTVRMNIDRIMGVVSADTLN